MECFKFLWVARCDLFAIALVKKYSDKNRAHESPNPYKKHTQKRKKMLDYGAVGKTTTEALVTKIMMTV